MGRLETNGYYALGAPLYFALALVDVLVARRRGQRLYGFADTLGNLSAGMGEVVIGLFIGPLLIGLYDWAFARFALVRWPEGSAIPWVLAFVLGDLCYYAYHRAGHRVAALWAIHGVHHQSERFNLSVALRHPWFSDFYSAVFYAPLPLLGVPPEHFFVAITLISFYALTIHSHSFRRPAFFLFVTPQTHVLHHAANPRYLGKNLGAMFTVWDRLFGTYVELDPADPPRLGTNAGYRTHDGARSQFILFADLLAAARRARGFGERLRVFLGPPGWRPPGVPREPGVPARSEASIPRLLRAYAAAQSALTVAFAVYVLWLREQHPMALLVPASAAILWSLSSVGGLLDGRPDAARREIARLGATAVLGAVLLTGAEYRVLGAALGIGAALSAVFLARVREAPAPAPLGGA